jgi:hypothetical protein
MKAIEMNAKMKSASSRMIAEITEHQLKTSRNF